MPPSSLAELLAATSLDQMLSLRKKTGTAIEEAEQKVYAFRCYSPSSRRLKGRPSFWRRSNHLVIHSVPASCGMMWANKRFQRLRTQLQVLPFRTGSLFPPVLIIMIVPFVCSFVHLPSHVPDYRNWDSSASPDYEPEQIRGREHAITCACPVSWEEDRQSHV